MRATRGIRRLLEAMEGLLGWQPIDDHGNIIGLTDPIGMGAISLEPGGQFELSGAPLDTLHQTCREVNGASRPGARMRDAPRHRLPRPRRLAELDARRDAGDAEVALRDHDPLHAEGRQPRPRHDVPHLHHPGQSRLRRRGRHGAEDARRPGAAADRHRALRQFAVHSTASRTASSPTARDDLAGHRQPPHRHAALRLRDGLRLRALRRLGARRADVFRQARRHLSRRRRRLLPRPARRPARRRFPASGRRCPTGRTTSRRSSPRCGSRTTSKCAAPTAGRAGASRRCRRSGSGSSTTRRRSTAPGTSSRTGPQRSGRSFATRFPRTALATPFRNRTVRDIAREVLALARGGLSRRRRLSSEGADETIYISSLEEIVASGTTSAERLLEEYRTDWNGNIDEIFRRHAY